MFKANSKLTALQKALMFACSDFNMKIIACDNTKTNGESIFTNKITNSKVTHTSKLSGLGSVDLIIS